MPELLMIAILIVGGLVLLFFGADWLVKGAVTMALHLGLSPLIVGLTIVALGTSLPEALVSVQASLDNQGGIALGNVIGSNICLLYTSPSPRDQRGSRMPSSA